MLTSSAQLNSTSNERDITTYSTSNIINTTVTGSTYYANNIINVSSGGVLSATNFSSGSILNVYNSGLTSDVTLYGGATATIYNGGIARRTGNYGVRTVSSGGQLSAGYVTDTGVDYILSGGITDNTYINNGGKTFASDSAVIRNTAIADGGTLYLSAGAIVSGGYVYSGGVISANAGAQLSGAIRNFGIISGGDVYGTINVSSGGVASSQIILDGGTINVTSDGSASQVIISNGGNLSIANGGFLDIATLENGGSMTVYQNNNGTIDLAGNNNTGLVISGLENGGSASLTINGFNGTGVGDSDLITLAGVDASKVTEVTYPDSNHVTFTVTNDDKSTYIITLNIVGIGDVGYSLGSTKDGFLTFEVCFLAGSMIRIPGGEVTVEDLRIGNDICTYDWVHNHEVIKRVSWVGNKSIIVKSNLPDDEAGYPVRISKDAIAKNIPYKDLLVTPEHCLFFDGKFIPVRMLVNGSSIRYDYSITNYTYYHIETEDHSVIWANNMLTESYLNTGNRISFKQHGDFVIFINKQSDSKNWEEDAYAPLVVDRSFVEPLYNKITQRAIDIGFNKDNALKLTNNPDFHLVTDNGDIIKPSFKRKNRYSFVLSEITNVIYLKSKTNRPCDTIGSFVDDRRSLGVLIGDINILTKNEYYSVTEHLTEQNLSGWNVVESSLYRWTNGSAMLNISQNNDIKQRIIVIEVLAGGSYLIDEEEFLKKIA